MKSWKKLKIKVLFFLQQKYCEVLFLLERTQTCCSFSLDIEFPRIKSTSILELYSVTAYWQLSVGGYGIQLLDIRPQRVQKSRFYLKSRRTSNTCSEPRWRLVCRWWCFPRKSDFLTSCASKTPEKSVYIITFAFRSNGQVLPDEEIAPKWPSSRWLYDRLS